MRNKIKALEENEKFYVWSKSLDIGIGIGLRKHRDKDNYQRVEVMTPIDVLYDSEAPILYVG